MSTQRVTAILVVHDGATWLPEVVTSLATQTRSADRIVAVDTGSVDASAKLLKGARIPTIYLVQWQGRWRRVYAACYSNCASLYIGKPGNWLATISVER